MNRRLQQFLELEQMKPAQLADVLGIQRSSVSHLLAGRNKPGYEFIQKFLLKFPSVNPDWLLLGRGKPFRDQQAPSFAASDSDGHDQNLFSEETLPDTAVSDIEPEYTNAREVKRVTLFYSDGTFKEFYPPK
ncbi:MAG TPA: helix-turn-helix domain-containing protein [Candidatus Coprenecus pullistercoris]|nr:helix-turn-helix domain-containing protein [Candidatus Coprenecus pullistercoris]